MKFNFCVIFSLLFIIPYTGQCQSNTPTFTSEDYLVSNMVVSPLLPGGEPLKNNAIYRVSLVTLGTGTHTGSAFIVWKDNVSGNWKIRNIALSGTTSNHPLLETDNNNTVIVKTNHSNQYNVRSFVESFPVGVPSAVPSLLGTSYQWQRDMTKLIYMDGNVGIGTTTPDAKLAVNGTIRAKEVNVTTSNWPDYVLTSTYKLRPLDSLFVDIKTNGHLSGIPTAAEVKANGQNLGEMNKKLLKKVEELTLYILQMNQEISQLKAKINK